MRRWWTANFARAKSGPPLQMDEIEITEIPPLTPGELSLLDCHSMVNVLNVLSCGLIVLGLTVADNEEHFSDGLTQCDVMVAALRDRELALRQAAEVGTMERRVFDELERKLGRELETDPRFADAVADLRAVFSILKLRARELLARAEAPERWGEFEAEAVRQDLQSILTAIEHNSHGRYRILYNAAQQQAGDYYVDLRVEAGDGARIVMPPVLLDVMRDLIANARKYTAPGGHITAALFEDEAGLRFVVRDDGRGIPPDEIRQVVAFGKRASNVGAVRTMGGGFGLTKAFLVTKQFGGRFWIASQPGAGTQVRLWIPRPV